MIIAGLASLLVFIDFSRSDLPVCQVFLPVLPTTSLETISNSETISSDFQSLFFEPIELLY